MDVELEALQRGTEHAWALCTSSVVLQVGSHSESCVPPAEHLQVNIDGVNAAHLKAFDCMGWSVKAPYANHLLESIL